MRHVKTLSISTDSLISWHDVHNKIPCCLCISQQIDGESSDMIELTMTAD